MADQITIIHTDSTLNSQYSQMGTNVLIENGYLFAHDVVYQKLPKLLDVPELQIGDNCSTYRFCATHFLGV